VENTKQEYKGKEIVYVVPEDKSYIGEIHVKIDQEHLHAIRLENGLYTTHFLPHQQYSSIYELAKDVIDKVPQFSKSSSR
jgi:hypothetical protein